MSSAPFLTRDSEEVQHCDDIFAQLNELRKSGQLCDCVLAIGKFNFPAHKAVLVEQIPFFADIFIGEAPKEDLMRVLRNIKPSILEALLLFAYERKIKITDENVEELLLAARTLGMEEVKMACIRYLCQRLDRDTVTKTMIFAKKNQVPELLDACRLFFCGCFERLLETDAFQNLTGEDMQQILASDRLNVSDESVVFRGLLVWIIFDAEARKDWLSRLFPLVRLPLIPRDFLESTVAQNELCRADEECRKLIDGVHGGARVAEYGLRKRRFWRDNSRFLFSVGTPIRKRYTVDPKPERAIEVYDRRLNKWEELFRPISEARVFVVLNEIIYGFGNKGGYGETEKVDVFNTLERRWGEVAPMHKARNDVGTVVLKQRIFVCGGGDTSCEIYDPPTDTWTLGPSMTSDVKEHCLVAINDRHVVALGGLGQGSSQNWAEVMTLNTAEGTSVADWFPARASVDCWQLMPRMLMKRSRHSACFFRGRIIVVGGGREATCAEMFVSEAESEGGWVPRGQWTLLPLLKTSSLTLYAGRIFSHDANGKVQCCQFSESKMQGKDEEYVEEPEMPERDDFPKMSSIALAGKSIDWEVLPNLVNSYTDLKGGTVLLPDYLFDFSSFCEAFSRPASS